MWINSHKQTKNKKLTFMVKGHHIHLHKIAHYLTLATVTMDSLTSCSSSGSTYLVEGFWILDSDIQGGKGHRSSQGSEVL